MNTIKIYPEVGDIMIKVGDDIRFLGQDATSDFVETQQAIGVVYYANGNHVKIVGGKNTGVYQWVCAVDYEIESIPTSTTDCAVTLQGKALGNFHYEKTAGTKEEFVTQLDAWLKINAPKFESYMYNGIAILQLSDYAEFSSTNTIAGCKLRKRAGEEISSYGTSAPLTQTGLSKWYCGVNYYRLLEFIRNYDHSHSNPTGQVTATGLFSTYPVSEKYYNGELGAQLREAYPTYEDYMKACMGQPWAPKTCTEHRNGKELCDKLKNKKLLVRGVEIPAYPAVDFAVNYDSGVQGYGKDTWWLPSYHELMLLMGAVTAGTKQPLDNINKSLAKKKGWQQITVLGNRWSASRCDPNLAWIFNSKGFAESYSFFNWFQASAVAAFNLKF